MVYQVSHAVDLPIIGMGGISTWRDAVEMMMAGANAVAVGTACFRDPMAPVKVRDGIEQFCRDQGVSNVSEIVGTVRPY